MCACMSECAYGEIAGVTVYTCTCVTLCVSLGMRMCVTVCVFVGSCLATKVFIGNLPAIGRGWVIIK